MSEDIYLCIDLKTFYASVECVERGLDPFSTNLIVADSSRGKGTICLAITPKMKMLGIKNRCRVYEIPENVKYIVAKPRMNKYIEYATNIYGIYLKYVAKEDIHVYSIDEAFLDITHYSKIYKLSAIDLAKKIMQDIYDTYGLTATCGIGTNLYLAKVALDIMSKHTSTNIGILDEELYKKELWHHKPLTDFWQIGRGIERRLNRLRIYDMYDIAHCKEERLYKEFGINAELLIDHSKGIETCKMADIKNYKPKETSISNSQILFRDYNYEETKTILKEMVELKSLELVDKKLKARVICLYIGYSKDQISSVNCRMKLREGESTYNNLIDKFLYIYENNVKRNIPIRRVGVSFGDLTIDSYEQLNLLEDHRKKEREKNLERAINYIKEREGKNYILKGMSYCEEATGVLRNKLIGGHNAK